MRFVFLFSAFISTIAAFAQDTLFTRDGQVIPAKVHEITQTEIKYKKPSNPDGPLYVVSKDEIAVIEYKNGSKDVFQYAGSSQTDPSAGSQGTQLPSQQQQPQVNNYYSTPQPNVNLMFGLGMMGGYWGAPAWGWGYRPWHRPYYYGNYWGWRPHYHNYGGWHGGGYGGWHGGHHRR
jgi:hypothetical protein